jgi:hypothetical protein
MTTLWALALPTLLSAAGVFVASSLIHMFTPWHKTDFAALAEEARLRAALRPLALPPGDYMVPRPTSAEEMRSSGFAAKMQEGPVIMMTVLPNGMTPMGRNLALWFAYCVVVGLLAGYLAAAALGKGAAYLAVFRLVGTAAFMGYALALWQASIWYRRSWTTTLKSTIDGLGYALLTAGIYGWLWPR